MEFLLTTWKVIQVKDIGSIQDNRGFSNPIFSVLKYISVYFS